MRFEAEASVLLFRDEPLRRMHWWGHGIASAAGTR
jgi:hypothetical protein